jgi:hypothetical protein
MYEIIKVWAVYEGETEFSSGKPEWFFTNENHSRALNEETGRGYYGSRAVVAEMPVIKIRDEDGFDYYFLLEREDPLRINFGPSEVETEKKKALDKLTKEEQKLLGLI